MKRPNPVDEEVKFDGARLISETDTKGNLTYVNRKFCEMSGYTKEEVLGKSHSILRHPDMPKAAFKDLWDTVGKGEQWDGYVKNLRKDGKYYWVIVNIIAKRDDHDNIIGYIASRRVPDGTFESTKARYKEIRDAELTLSKSF